MVLGLSKFTVQSEEDIEDFAHKPTFMDESSIILNIFGASESQIKKWEKNSHKNF
jgi:hypothetical protein